VSKKYACAKYYKKNDADYPEKAAEAQVAK
jgi:hypothetical protein